MSKRPMKDIIVLLPGIMGSVLERDGKPVWDLSGRALLRFLFSGGNTLKSLTLTDDPVDDADLGDGITAPRLLPDAQILKLFSKICFASHCSEPFTFPPLTFPLFPNAQR